MLRIKPRTFHILEKRYHWATPSAPKCPFLSLLGSLIITLRTWVSFLCWHQHSDTRQSSFADGFVDFLKGLIHFYFMYMGFKIYLFLCIWVFACMYVWIKCVPGYCGGQEVKYLKTGVPDSCKLSCWRWKPNLGPLQEQPVLWTAEPSLEPWECVFLNS